MTSRRAQARPTASPWAGLEVDWATYATEAALLLDAPLYWRTKGGLAPHAEGPGATVLQSLRTWLACTPEGDPRDFLLEHLALHNLRVEEEAHDLTVVGLAFGLVKLRGTCPEELLGVAHRAVERLARRRPDEEEQREARQLLAKLSQLRRRRLGLTVPFLPEAL